MMITQYAKCHCDYLKGRITTPWYKCILGLCSEAQLRFHRVTKILFIYRSAIALDYTNARACRGWRRAVVLLFPAQGELCYARERVWERWEPTFVCRSGKYLATAMTKKRDPVCTAFVPPLLCPTRTLPKIEQEVVSPRGMSIVAKPCKGGQL